MTSVFLSVSCNSNGAAPSSVVYAICIEMLLYSDVELIELSKVGGWGQPMGCCVIGNKKITFVGLWLKDYIE